MGAQDNGLSSDDNFLVAVKKLSAIDNLLGRELTPVIATMHDNKLKPVLSTWLSLARHGLKLWEATFDGLCLQTGFSAMRTHIQRSGE